MGNIGGQTRHVGSGDRLAPDHNWTLTSPVVHSAVFPRNKPDTFYARYFLRYFALPLVVIAGRRGISANAVSFGSIPVAVVAGMLLCMPSMTLRVAGAIVLNLWVILDCVDGSLARLRGSQPFGDYLDGISGYIAMTGLLVGAGVGGAHELGWGREAMAAMICGFVAATANLLTRLCYQKFANAAAKVGMAAANVKRPGGLMTKIDFHLGVSGLGALVLIPAVALSQLHVLVVGYCALYVGAAVAFVAASVRKVFGGGNSIG